MYLFILYDPFVCRDEEGEEHLRKRSMHLPFTFTTGEALLYQTGFPLHGFPDSFQGKAKGSKPKKGKVHGSTSEELNPKSLLGALMSQDESVYVCQPDSEPKMTIHSKTDGLDGLLSSNSWNNVSNSDVGRCSSTSRSFDPLLATLDSLSLDGGETCSNSELFSALENLGLNAEDLELLLLDERMIQVDLDPNHVPSLTDLLTNHEILSYIHDSLESGSQEQGSRSGPDPGRSVTQQACYPHAAPPALPSIRQPIIQLSQQMQQHMRAQTVQTQPFSHPGVGNTNEPSRHHGNHIHQHPQREVNATHKLLNPPVESSQQWSQQHIQQQVSGASTALLDFQNQLAPTTNGSYIPTGLTAFPPPHVEVGQPDYSAALAADAGGAVLNISTPDMCHHQSAAWPVQLQGPRVQTQMQLPASCLSQSSAHSSALELERLLALQPQHSLPSLEAYGVLGSAPDSKVRHHHQGRTSFLLLEVIISRGLVHLIG